MPSPVITPNFQGTGNATARNIKAASGRLYFVEASNIDAGDRFLQLFDALAADVTVGTTTPVLSLFIPAGDATFRGAMDKFFDPPIQFAAAISFAVTTTATGSTGPTTAVVVNAGYS